MGGPNAHRGSETISNKICALIFPRSSVSVNGSATKPYRCFAMTTVSRSRATTPWTARSLAAYSAELHHHAGPNLHGSATYS